MADISWINEVNMTKCCKQRQRFFEKYESIDCSSLITYWMMAGYLGSVKSVEKAYEKGFEILMEMKHKGMLCESINKVTASTDADPSHCSHEEYCAMPNVRLDDFLDMQKLDKVTLTGGMLKDDNGSVLVLDGDHLSESVLSTLRKYKYIVCFDILPDSVKVLLENVGNPSLLVLRVSETSWKTDFSFQNLKALTVLEISDVRYLNNIPELPLLQCLKLSGLLTKELPEECFSELILLRWLILRRCPKLKTLPSIKGLVNLEMLDLSFCLDLSSLTHDTVSSPKLEIVDLSCTAMRNIPQLETIQLTHLFLRGTELSAFGAINHPSKLQLLDLSGAGQLQEIDLSPYNELEVLDLSNTRISSIDTISNKNRLRKVVLCGCERLEKLPCFEKLTSLELLDVSHCKRLTHLPDLSNQRKLKVLDLSETQASHLPSFAYPSCLLKLSARGLDLVSLDMLASLSNLEELDLRRVKISSSDEFSTDFLASLEKLRVLNLSQTSVADLPAMANHDKLRELLLVDCPHLSTLPDVNTLKNVEKLEISMSSNSSSLNKLVLTNSPGVKHERNAVKSLDSDIFFQESMNELFDLIPQIEEALESSVAVSPSTSDSSSHEDNSRKIQLKTVKMDLELIKKHEDRLKDSSNCNRACELLQHLRDIGPYRDSFKSQKLIQTVAKLKLLLPRTQTRNTESSEPIKKKMNKMESRRDGINAADDIIKKLVSYDSYQVQRDGLQSSYKSLSSNEKHCLLCFSIFPLDVDEGKDKGVLVGKSLEVKNKMLIYWWVGEGLINPDSEEGVATQDLRLATPTGVGKRKKTVEEIGEGILNALTEKGFIHPVIEKGWKTGRCCMHPFVHSFVTEQAERDGFLDSGNKLPERSESTHIACILRSQGCIPSTCQIWQEYAKSSENSKRFRAVKTLFNVDESVINIQPMWFYEMKDLLTLLLGNWRSGDPEHIEVANKTFLQDLDKMKLLKLFSLQGVSTVTKLPDSVCKLANLMILDLKECHDLEELPAQIGLLKNLTHLDISNCHFLTKMPEGISSMSKLEVLKGFVVYDKPGSGDPLFEKANILRHWLKTASKKNEVCTLWDLLKLGNLRELSIVVNREDFPNSKELKVFKEMENLRKLVISWRRCLFNDDVNVNSGQIIRNLKDTTTIQDAKNGEKKPSREHLDQIEKLGLWCFPHETAPEWLVPNQLKNLQKLCVRGGRLKMLPGGTGVSKWKVTTLRLKYLPNLELIGWVGLKSKFPNLTYLEQYKCSTHYSFSPDVEDGWVNDEME